MLIRMADDCSKEMGMGLHLSKVVKDGISEMNCIGQSSQLQTANTNSGWFKQKRGKKSKATDSPGRPRGYGIRITTTNHTTAASSED